MAKTIQGGAYLAVDGKTWHDADGKPLPKDKVKEAEDLLAEKAEQNEAAESEERARLAAANKVFVMNAEGSTLAKPKAEKTKAEKTKE